MLGDWQGASWYIGEIGGGRVFQTDGAIALQVPSGDGGRYHDAQMSDYAPSASRFMHRPPLRLEVQAQAMTPVARWRGTAGFGFWNHPFVPNERGWRLPAAVWFFFSAPPSDMPLALGVGGHGWKCATFDARHWSFIGLLPFAPLGFLLMRVPAIYRRLWPVGQRAIGVNEYMLDADLLAQLHRYVIEWYPREVRFSVDGRLMYRAPSAPRGPLGFIAWVDNQYAIVTPQGRFGAGFVPLLDEQILRIASVQIAPLAS